MWFNKGCNDVLSNAVRTGALRLYQSAGMHVHNAYGQFEKEMRPGKEISVQSL